MRRLLPVLLLASVPALAEAANAPRQDLTIDPATIMRPFTGDLDEMVARRIIRVLVVPSKTFYFNDNGTQRGAVYDTFQLIEKELYKELRKTHGRKTPRVKFFYVPIGRDQIFPALMAGKGDIAAANLTITPSREALVDFAGPHMSGVRELVLTGPASPVLSTLDDLAGREVFVRKSSSYYESLVKLNQRFAAESKPLVKLKEAPDELEDEDLIEMLNAGLVSILVVDDHVAHFWKKVFPKIVVHDAIAVDTEADIAWALRKDSPKLKAFLDRMATAVTKGHLADERAVILTRYLKHLTHVKNAASDAERRKFLSLVELFRKYGDRYDVDWMLMAAQGYQESRLDQKARSPVGAIGVMQLMPATGKDMNVGDIASTEPNINAGVKYMRFMIDHYYENEPMTKLDKALFAFASYNAGAGRIRQVRRLAEKRGFDPNVWFHNVENVAQEKIGHETVTYVGNIYKYFVAYRLIEDSLQDRREALEGLKTKRP